MLYTASLQSNSDLCVHRRLRGVLELGWRWIQWFLRVLFLGSYLGIVLVAFHYYFSGAYNAIAFGGKSSDSSKPFPYLNHALRSHPLGKALSTLGIPFL